MAKPKAARGKVTRIEKIKRAAKELANKPGKDLGSTMNMSPGAMGGRTPRPLRQMAPTIPEIKRGNP